MDFWEHFRNVTKDNPIGVKIRSLQESLVEVARFKGGYFLVVNPATRVAALHCGYDSCCDSCLSLDGVPKGLKLALKDAVPCEEMYRRAKLCMDLKFYERLMQWIMPEYNAMSSLSANILEYEAESALYTSYLLFYEQTLTPMARMPCTEWRCREWTKDSVKAIVKFQALWRGWHLRHRILFSPHTNLGRRFLQHQWNRYCLEDSLSNQESKP